MKELPNFIECYLLEDANKIDLEIYTFIRYSETKNCYIFKKRNVRKKYDQETEQDYCECIYLKGKYNGNQPKLKLKISNVSTCELNPTKFKTEVKE